MTDCLTMSELSTPQYVKNLGKDGTAREFVTTCMWHKRSATQFLTHQFQYLCGKLGLPFKKSSIHYLSTYCMLVQAALTSLGHVCSGTFPRVVCQSFKWLLSFWLCPCQLSCEESSHPHQLETFHSPFKAHCPE